MKKIFKFWWIVLILIPVIFTGYMLLKAKNTENNRKISQEYASKLVIPPDGNYNKNNIEDINERVGMIHPRYLKAIFDNSIFIRIDARYGPGLGIHEVAHAVDNVLFNLRSSSDEFKNNLKEGVKNEKTISSLPKPHPLSCS